MTRSEPSVLKPIPRGKPVPAEARNSPEEAIERELRGALELAVAKAKKDGRWLILFMMSENAYSLDPHTVKFCEDGIEAEDDHGQLCRLPLDGIEGWEMEP